jgi:D-serine deaminase-like pyridoxal phosphate-dependent protein
VVAAPSAITKADYAFRAFPVPIEEVPTPVVTLDLDAVEHNVTLMAEWCRAAGVDLCPHGKTTMAPELWQMQLDAGAWGITLATAYQARVALDSGVERIILAGTTFSSAALAALFDTPRTVLLWVDSADAVAQLDRAAVAVEVDVPVLVDFGGTGNRTGAPTVAEAVTVAEQVHRSTRLVLAGVAGFEGALTHDIDAAAFALVDGYLSRFADVHAAIPSEWYSPWIDRGGPVVLTAGGSVYFDRVAAVLGALHDPAGTRGMPTRVIARSGAYLAHDSSMYLRISPFSRTKGARPFRPALHLWSTVISRSNDGVAILDFGKRDASYDEGYPVPLNVYSRASDGSLDERSGGAEDLTVTAMNDQHAFVHTGQQRLVIGDVVRLGISHPCTTFDRWPALAAVRSSTGSPAAADVERLVRTYF